MGGSLQSPVLLESGVIRLAAEAAFPHRLATLRVEIDRVVSALGPTAAAVESPFHGVNPRSALQLAHARGVVLCVLAGAGLEVVEYSPATVKKSVTGSGRADKDQVRFMVARTVRGGSEVHGTDQTDAIAVALCHLCAIESRLQSAGRP